MFLAGKGLRAAKLRKSFRECFVPDGFRWAADVEVDFPTTTSTATANGGGGGGSGGGAKYSGTGAGEAAAATAASDPSSNDRGIEVKLDIEGDEAAAAGGGRGEGGGERRYVELALWRVSGEFFAVSAKCPHMGGPMAQGKVLDMRLLDVEDAAGAPPPPPAAGAAAGPSTAPLISCPWHFFTFDMHRGNCVTTSCGALDVHAAEVILGSVYVSLRPTATGGVAIESGSGSGIGSGSDGGKRGRDGGGNDGDDDDDDDDVDAQLSYNNQPPPAAVVDFAPDGSMRRIE